MNNPRIVEIQKRFAVNNAIIVYQAIEKLRTLIYERLENVKFIDGKTNTIPEIEFLWEKCTDKSSLVADGACKIFISLVLNRQADYMWVVNGFVNQALSKSNVSNVIAALKDMLTLPVLVEDKLVGQLFNLRCPLHPFIRILKIQPDLWHFILEQMQLILTCCKMRNDEAYISLVHPILQYIIWDPVRPVNFLPMRHLLLRALVTFCSCSPKLALHQCLHRSVFWMQVDTVVNIHETSLHLKEIATLYLSLQMKDCCTFNDDLLLCLLSTCLDMSVNGLDTIELLDIIEQLILRTIKIPATEESQASVLILALLLKHSIPSHQSRIIKICTHLLSRKGIDPLVMGALFMPLIVNGNVASFHMALPVASNLSVDLQVAAMNLLNFLEKKLHIEDEVQLRKSSCVSFSPSKNENMYRAGSFCVKTLTAVHIVHLAKKVKEFPGAIDDWLKHASRLLQSGIYISDAFLCMASSFLIHGFQDIEVVTHLIDFLVECGKQDHEKAPNVIAVLLYKLRTDRNSLVRMHILKCIPLLGIHKPCTSNILQTLLALNEAPSMKAFAVHLMNLLWQSQERVFPHLHKMIVEENKLVSLNSVTNVDEVALAKAAAILDVCKLKPHLYGAELLTVLSKIISDNTSESGTSLTSLALDSIISLCKSEVIDLFTTWRFLAPKLKLDRRHLVKKKLCEFLSLAEALRVETVEYEKFILDCVFLLWRFATTDDNAAIVGVAYRALAKFDSSRHALKLLPQQVKSKVKLPPKMAATPFEASQRPEDVLQYVPGSAYLDLLTMVPLSALPDYGEFLCALVRQEVRDMPRSVLYLSRTISSAKNRHFNETINDIPQFVLEQHKSRCPPSITGSLALGLLLSYCPQAFSNKEGKATRHSVIQRGKSYDNMLETLLMQASLEISDWRKIIITPSAWSVFIERAYFSVIEARIVSLELQQQEKSPGSTEECDTLKKKAWLWARDKICDTLKRISRGKPSFHGNSILALAGLLAAVTKYSNFYNETKSSDEVVEGSEHFPHKYWMNEAIKAILNILSLNNELDGSPFSWCRPVSGSSSSIIQTYAALATVSLAPILVTWDTDVIRDILVMLHQQMLVASATYPVLQFCVGLAFGQFISSLVSERYCDVGGDEGKVILLSNAEKLKLWCFDGELDTKCGGLLGLSMATSSFCQERCKECDEFVLTTLDDYTNKLQQEMASCLVYDVLLIGHVLITATASGYRLLTHDAPKLLFDLQQQVASSPNNIGKATAYGLLLQYLASTGSKQFLEARENQLRYWVANIKSKSVPTLAKLASVHGAFSLFPTCLESTFFQGFDVNVAEAIKSPLLSEFIKVLCHVLSSTNDVGVQNCSAWMLGLTFFNLTQKSESSDEATDYSFLGDNSILKPVVNLIHGCIKTGFTVHNQPHLIICFKCLSQVVDRPYPALHWPSLLKPYLSISEELQELVADVIIARASNSSSACALLSSWMNSSTIILTESCKIKLFSNLYKLIHIVTAKTIQSFLGRNVLEIFNRQPLDVDVSAAFIKGVLRALQSLNPTAEVMQILHFTVVDIFHHIDQNCSIVWDYFCMMAAELPDEILDQMTIVDTNQPVTIVKAVMLRCQLVGSGMQPIDWLNECVDAAAVFMLNAIDRNVIDKSFLACFQNHSRVTDNGSSRTTARMTWLLEIMGHIRNVMEWQSSLCISDINQMKKVMLNLFHVFTLSVIGWCGTAIDLHYFCWMPKNNGLSDYTMELLPCAIKALVSSEPWSLHAKQIFEWLLLVCKNSSTPEVVQHCIKKCFLIIRHCPDFKKTSLWSRVIELEGF